MGAMGRHVLVVDDDQEIRTLLAEYLERNGLRVSTLADGRDLLRAVEERGVDLVVLDLMMPGPDGLALCRDLRAKSRVPVLMLSARGEDVDRIVGLEMGADDYLPKPFNPRELVARIHAVLRRHGERLAPGERARQERRGEHLLHRPPCAARRSSAAGTASTFAAST